MDEHENIDDEKPEDWKNKLSPAFNEEEILFSLLVLGNFYVVYVIVKSSFDVYDNSADDEERFVQSCFCSLNQRIFFRFWFGFCFLLWLLIHSYNFFAQLSVRRLHKFEDIIKVFLAFCIVCPCYSLCGVYKWLCNCFNQCLSKCWCKEQSDPMENEGNLKPKSKEQSKLSISIVQANKIKLVRKNISLLWFQYSKLYVVGYTRYNDKIQSIKSIMNKIELDHVHSAETENGCCFLECNKRGENVICTHPCCCLRCSRQCCSQCGSESTCPDINIVCCNKHFHNRILSKDIIRAFLFSVKYISQLVTVPLLLLQIFDTYSFLCFSPDSYCSHTTEYKQHVVQAAITLFFYCSLVISHLASILLIWNPWPKHDKSKSVPEKVSKVQKKDLFKVVQNKFEETFNDKTSWTIYFLIDLKMVYIITFGLITIINLISATATIHASTDKSSTMLFNVSSKYMNVNVTSINDPVLWNCRQFSETSDSYKFLYWMVIMVLIAIMSGLLVIKFVSLIVVNSCCGFKCCIYRSSTFKHGLTKLWHIAIHKKLIDLIMSQKSPASKASAAFSSSQASSLNEAKTEDGLLSEDDIKSKSYAEMLKEDIPDDVVKTLSCKNFCRSIIPYILLFLSVAIMCLAYSSYDLHPLACLVEPDEELITYEENKVELKFSTSLLLYQKIGGILVFCLGIIFLAFVRLFLYCTEQIVEELYRSRLMKN